jgi:hypothetical protein
VASTHPFTIYLNGQKLTPEQNNMITYNFIKGVNVLEVIVSISNSNPVSLNLNLDLLKMGNSLCGNRDPMRAVSLFDLRYNTNNQIDVYSLHDAGDKYILLVKDKDLSIRYELVYDYVTDPISDIRVKAVLQREQSTVDITPRLISYEVRFL